MRVLLLGAGGMLGHKVLQALSDHQVLGTLHGDRPPMLTDWPGILERVDVTCDLDDLYRWGPDVVVNCVGVIKQRDTTPTDSIEVNALLPHRLAARGVRVIHFSTDCVFTGHKGGYRLSDEPDAADLYGRTKILGEIGAPHLTLRTSIIGRELAHHQSLLEWFLAQTTVSGYRRVMWSGVTTNWLASVVAGLIDSDLTGVWQVAGPPISKHDLLVMIRDEGGLDIDILPEGSTVLDRTMIGDRFTGDTGIAIPSWRDMISDMVGDPTPYGELHE